MKVEADETQNSAHLRAALECDGRPGLGVALLASGCAWSRIGRGATARAFAVRSSPASNGRLGHDAPPRRVRDAENGSIDGGGVRSAL
jgi:hypothetical protein